ncbi:uncharacterized protein TNCT_521341 [Trichonephila clavata]|uniref:Uncharacterized protein n=1 Tax=Trichonephila clavata TaxID=2740835 RepID=A0A8X6KWN4_TRICU|nr:uncharacterized protein TNCT_521341 [Trichonephila clavata]
MGKKKWYLDILKLSMIPGIAAVSQSKNRSMFSFRLCVLLCAVTGFVWQTKVLVEEYLRYPTVLDIRNQHIALLYLPGVTFCFINGLQGKTYCPETSCKKLTVKEFKELYPGEKLPSKPEDFLVPLNLSEVYLLPPKRLLEILEVDYLPSVALYLNYFQVNMGEIKMKPAPIVRSYSSVPPMCFYFNVLGKNESYLMTVKKTPFLTEAELHLRRIHMINGGKRLDAELNMGQISVHSQNNFNNPFLTGVSIENGKNIILRVRQVLKKSLPYPYETDCHDYVTEIEESSSPGPTNLMECIEQCKLKLSLLNHDCVLESIWYPHNYQRCRPSKYKDVLE